MPSLCFIGAFGEQREIKQFPETQKRKQGLSYLSLKEKIVARVQGLKKAVGCQPAREQGGGRRGEVATGHFPPTGGPVTRQCTSCFWNRALHSACPQRFGLRLPVWPRCLRGFANSLSEHFLASAAGPMEGKHSAG